MEIKPDEIASILRERIQGLDTGSADLSEVGTVLSVAARIAPTHGLHHAMALQVRDPLPVPGGGALLGRLVDPPGRPLDDKGEIATTQPRPAEFKAPGVVQRQ